MQPTKQIFNSTTQQVEEAKLTVDKNGEIVATFADSSFLKFPNVVKIPTEDAEGNVTVSAEPITPELLDGLIADVQTHNVGQVVITPEMEAAELENKQAALTAIGVDVSDAEAVATATVPVGIADNQVKEVADGPVELETPATEPIE